MPFGHQLRTTCITFAFQLVCLSLCSIRIEALKPFHQENVRVTYNGHVLWIMQVRSDDLICSDVFRVYQNHSLSDSRLLQQLQVKISCNFFMCGFFLFYFEYALLLTCIFCLTSQYPGVRWTRKQRIIEPKLPGSTSQKLEPESFINP